MASYQKWWTQDEEFGVRLPATVIAEMYDAFDKCNGMETGGILLGKYIGKNCAEVTAITTAPPDSKAGPTWFKRGVRKLQEMVDAFWNKKREFYLGEWHCHPNGAAKPSGVDADQMYDIANSRDYKCPEPILIIVGGQPNRIRNIGVFVFPKGRSVLPLSAGPDPKTNQ